MSKSLGNVLSMPAMLQRVRPAELRYYLGARTTGRCSRFSETASTVAGESLCRSWGLPAPRSRRWAPSAPAIPTPRFAEALDDDLSVPIALAEIHHVWAEAAGLDATAATTGPCESASAIRAMMGILGPARPALGIETKPRQRWPPSMCWSGLNYRIGKGPRAAQLGARRRDRVG